MSVNYSADVICGFKLRIEPLCETVTKHNEETGEPYDKEVYSHDVAMVGNVALLDTKTDPDCLCEGETYQGLTIFKSGYEQGVKYLGISLANVGDHYGYESEFDFKIPAQVQKLADELGVEPYNNLIFSIG